MNLMNIVLQSICSAINHNHNHHFRAKPRGCSAIIISILLFKNPMWPLLLLAVVYSQPSHFFQQFETQAKQPLFAKTLTLGRTVNDNPLIVHLLTKTNFSEPNQLHGKNAVLVNSYMHAREPYSLQLLERLAQEILQRSATNEIDYFVNSGVFIFFPFVNPDGYARYVQGDPQIRKNLNTGGVRCASGIAGVDINRNFPSSFGTVKGSEYPCGEEYHGRAPFSQPQAMVFKQLFQSFNILIAIDIHSYGNEWIYPYASDQTGLKVQKHQLYPFYKSIKKQFETRNRKVRSCIESLNYVADGVYIDWALDQGALSLAFEVGSSFRNDPKEQIAKDIEKGVEDFFLILGRTAQKYEVKVEVKRMVVTSQSLAKLRLLVKVSNRTQEAELKAGEMLEFALLPEDTHAVITNLQTQQKQGISLKLRGINLSLSPLTIISILGVFLAGMLLSFYTRWQDLTRRQANLNLSISAYQLPTIQEQ